MNQTTRQTKVVPGRLVTALDLGQTKDFSALLINEQTVLPNPDPKLPPVLHHTIRYIHRWPLFTPSPTVVADVKQLHAMLR